MRGSGYASRTDAEGAIRKEERRPGSRAPASPISVPVPRTVLLRLRPSCLARGLIGFPEGLANFSRQHRQANALVILLRRAGPGGGLGAFPASPANSMASATAGSPQRSSKNPLIVSPQQVGCRMRPFAEGTRIASRSAWLMGDGTELLTCASGRSFHSAKTGLPFLSLTLLFFDDLKKDRICSAELKW
jgi:hypothetical protein